MHTEKSPLTCPSYETAKVGDPVTLYAPALDFGQVAQNRLIRRCGWSVLARFHRSMYLRNEQGSIICLCNLSINSGPLNVRCALPQAIDWRDLDIGSEERVEVKGDVFRLGKRIRFYLGQARNWTPGRVPGLHGDALPRLEAILSAAADYAPNDGLASIFRPTRSQFADDHQSSENPVLDAAAPVLQSLAQWLKEAFNQPTSQICEPPPGTTSLIGLGPGLTPSGDDYLGGLMIGLHATKRIDLASKLARLVLPEARRRTGAISYAHLACAATGQGGAPLHQAIAAIAGSGPLDIMPCLDAIRRMGATSGWDSLAGAILPFRILLNAGVPGVASDNRVQDWQTFARR